MKTVSVAVLAGIVCAFVQPVSAAQTGTFKERVLHSFADVPDGADPEAGLIDVKGILYGTTEQGGAHYRGTVFSLDPGTGAETVLCSFSGGADGGNPVAGLTDVGGILYGTTYEGGAHNLGTVFSFEPSTGTETVLHAFSGLDGQFPQAGLIYVGGILYGTTAEGGAHYRGAVFAIDPNTGTETVVYSFTDGTHGGWPRAGLIDVNGILYGTTYYGGTRHGTVFAVEPETGRETVLHAFSGGSDGAHPDAGLINVNGMLYGTTHRGGGGSCGNAGCGIVFSLDPNTGTETVLHAFNGADGADPKAGLVSGAGLLYGTTYAGGRDHDGTVFSIDPSTGAEAVVYSFCTGRRRCPDGGERPKAGLIDVHGKLYGTTSSGGADGDGTVFELKEKRR